MIIVDEDYSWYNDPSLNGARWKGIKRDYTAADVIKLQGKYKIHYTIASMLCL